MNPIRCAAIIAGGASRRMGQNKALLNVNGEPLVARVAGVLQPLFSNLVVVTRDEEIARAANFVSIPDIHENKGPLGGIHAALEYFQEATFCVACDLPFLNADAIQFLLSQLENYDAVLPRVNERAEPLHAVYTPRCAPVFEAELQAERARRVEKVLQSLNARFIEGGEWKVFDEELKMFTNINTPDEARAAGFSL